MRVQLVKTAYFDAAHRNPAGGPAQQRLHGHSYRVDLVAGGEVAEASGWLVDFGDIKRVFRPLYDQLDHHALNEVEGLAAPTVPALRLWMLERLAAELPCVEDVRLTIVGDCSFRPVELPPDASSYLPARIRFTFEAAQYLPQLPEGHPCRRLHGHSYRVEVAAADPRTLVPHLQATYDLVDHRCLNEIPELGHATCERMCEWLWKRLVALGAAPSVIAIEETNTSRCIYRGG